MKVQGNLPSMIPDYIPPIALYQRTQKAPGDIYRWLNVWKTSSRPY